MRALGDKIASTIVAQTADVPTMPWSGTGNFSYHSENYTKPTTISTVKGVIKARFGWDNGCVTSDRGNNQPGPCKLQDRS